MFLFLSNNTTQKGTTHSIFFYLLQKYYAVLYLDLFFIKVCFLFLKNKCNLHSIKAVRVF